MSIAHRGALAGISVSISVSGCEDLLSLGFLDTEILRTIGDVVRSLIYGGATLHYGGDLRTDELNFTTAIALEAAEMYRASDLPQREMVFVNHVAFDTWRRWTPEQLFRHAVRLGDFGHIKLYGRPGSIYRLYTLGEPVPVALGVHGQIDSAQVFVEATRAREGSVGIVEDELSFAASSPAELARLWRNCSRDIDRDDPACRAASLTAMRQGMACDENARILICGRTRSEWERGRAGVAEEALISFEAGRLVLPIPSFGGCAHDVALALGLLQEPLLKRNHGPDYAEQLKLITEQRERYVHSLKIWGIAPAMLGELMTSDNPQRLAQLICLTLETSSLAATQSSAGATWPKALASRT
jgi:SLOG cluster2